MEESLAFKIIVIGQPSVGKSSLLIRYIKGQFNQAYNVTVGVEFASKQVIVNDNMAVKLQIWDTAGQQTFRAIVKSFYKGISGVFLVYSIANEQSFQALYSWHSQACQNGDPQMIFFIIGSHADLQHCRKVSGEKVEAFLKSIGAVFYIECSAKTNTNVSELFEKAAKIMHKKYISNAAFRHLVRPTMTSGLQMMRPNSILLGKNKTKVKRRCCH